jgi:two-component system sensor histidine kinase KdpD
VSHEFRIPLAAIMGAADTLMANQYPEEIKQDLYSQIFTASNRLNRLVDNLLNISRLENRKVAPNIDWVDIQDLFNQVVSDLEEDLKPFKITLEISSEMPLVKLDFGLIAQALYNLVDNSCKYAKPDSTITLKAFYDSGYLIIQEADRGPGFAPGAQEVLFNKFYRADQNTSGGLGLGLSIVQGFVEAHGGTISADNRAGGGAVFTIKIPTQISYTDNTLT